MAKKKKKKTVKKGFDHSAELYGIILVLIAILGIGKYGPVGRIFASFGLFLVGSLYIVFLAVLLIVGFYLLIKREWPDFFSTKLIGIYAFVIGFLVMMHREFVLENDGNAMLVFKETINQLVAGFNGIMNNGLLEDWFAVGGGLIGGVFSIILVKLVSYTGMQIVAWVLMIAGLSMFTGFSIIEKVQEKVTAQKEKLAQKRENKEKKIICCHS